MFLLKGTNCFHTITLLALVWVVTNINCQSKDEHHIVENNVIIIKDDFSGDSVDSSFGYTVSLLKNYNDLPENGKSTGWVFIGAPKSDDVSPPIFRDNNIRKEPGVIWRCSLGSSTGESCQMLGLQPPSSHSQPACYNRNKPYCNYLENQTDGWFGGSMDVASLSSSRDTGSYGSLVGCGPRWQRLASKTTYTKDDLVNGVCYWVVQENLSSENLQNLQGSKLVPLWDEGQQFYPVRDNQGKEQQDYEYHYGQAGFSSHLTKEFNLVLGAPGVHTWSGSVVYYEDSTSVNNRPAILHPEYYSSSIGILDLVGYVVTSGKFDVGSGTMLAVGAPRSKGLLGSVLIFRKPINGEFNVNILPTVLIGDQLGSYFGSVICAVDIDGDNLDDLLVGAPFYTTDDKTTTVKGISGDQGCVFIFRKLRKEKLCSSSLPGSRFGSAITSLGDINNDGLNDFAVGAPFENDGVGKVYIYHGSGSIFNSDSRPNQIIDPSIISVDPNLRNFRAYSFGSSLHGGIDVDNNGTPDLVIGSYASKSVFVYRTRPTIEFKPQVNFFIDDRIATKFKRTEKAFTAKLCVFYNIMPQQRGIQSLKVWNRFTVDNAHRRFTVSVEKNNDKIREANSGHFTEFLYEVKNTNRYCIQATIRLNKEFEAIIPELQQQIHTKFDVWYNDTKDIPLKRTTYSIRKSRGNYNPEVSVDGKGFKSFCSFCPTSKVWPSQSDSLSIENDDCKSENECQSDLKFSEITGVYDENDRRILSDKKGQYTFVLGSSKYITLKVDVINKGETAYNPIIDIKVPEVEGIRILENGNCQYAYEEKDERDSRKLLKCRIEHPLHRNKHMQKEIKIEVRDFYATSHPQLFQISVAAYPLDIERQSVSRPFNVLLTAKTDEVTLSGSVDHKPISGNNSETIFTHKYRGSIRGPSSVGVVVLEFKIPVNITKAGVTSQKISVERPTGIVCEPKTGTFSSLKLDADRKSSSLNTTNNAVNIRSRKIRSTDSVMVHCKDSKGWQCMEIHCKTKLKANGNINVEFQMSINNNLAKSLLKDKKDLTITSKGSIYILKDKKKENKSFARTTFVVTKEEDFPAWIAFVAVIGGLILLLLITFCLAKCGFFRRKTKEDLKKLKRQTLMESDALLGGSVRMRNLNKGKGEENE